MLGKRVLRNLHMARSTLRQRSRQADDSRAWRAVIVNTEQCLPRFRVVADRDRHQMGLLEHIGNSKRRRRQRWKLCLRMQRNWRDDSNHVDHMNSPCIEQLANGRFRCRNTGRMYSPAARPPIHCSCDMHTPRKPGLGDRVSQALSLVGITEARVSKLLGRPCGCGKRREALNRLGKRLRKMLP
jgi:hypothetical protein